MEAILAVLKTVETGSFSAAADALNVTHGSISRRVSSVEKWAGVRLFERHGRGVRLAPHARDFISHLEMAVAIIDDSPRHVEVDETVEVLRISVVPSFARLFLLPNIAEIEGNHPDVGIELDVNQQLQSLSRARMAIRHGSGQWSGVHAIPLFRETLYPVAGPNVAEALGENPSPASLLDYPLIIDMPDLNWKTWFAANDIDFRPRSIDRAFPDYDLALMAAAQGRGITLMRHPFGADLAARLGLRQILDSRIQSKTQFYIVSQLGARTETIKRVCARIVQCSSAYTQMFR